MFPRRIRVPALILPLVIAACSDASTPTDVTSTEVGLAAADRAIWMLDRCEPASFNEAVGPGTCVGSGKVTFGEFIATLAKKHEHPQWRFQPKNIVVQKGRSISIANRGGEDHTFTEVEAFGGGIVPDLNELAETPEVAPECLALGDSDFLPPGSVTPLEAEGEGTELYQCCIHPWMRAQLTIR